MFFVEEDQEWKIRILYLSFLKYLVPKPYSLVYDTSYIIESMERIGNGLKQYYEFKEEYENYYEMINILNLIKRRKVFVMNDKFEVTSKWHCTFLYLEITPNEDDDIKFDKNKDINKNINKNDNYNDNYNVMFIKSEGKIVFGKEFKRKFSEYIEIKRYPKPILEIYNKKGKFTKILEGDFLEEELNDIKLDLMSNLSNVTISLNTVYINEFYEKMFFIDNNILEIKDKTLIICSNIEEVRRTIRNLNIRLSLNEDYLYYKEIREFSSNNLPMRGVCTFKESGKISKKYKNVILKCCRGEKLYDIKEIIKLFNCNKLYIYENREFIKFFKYILRS